MFLDIIHRPVYVSKHSVSKTGFCLRLPKKPNQLDPIHRASPRLRATVPTQDRLYKPNTVEPSARAKIKH
jgi:hypothetical protein